ncbi:uncharacterized protein LOC113388449 [Ctenocephalides felis]|uniref:uncharacterized protein LOC113388449 n=1 Tax=Ctenocephalides felis TaxID=7515 RepID=UPI000E6E2702|nr:uncharacterized protein LOC113388449 [Ctenocephalides felis]
MAALACARPEAPYNYPRPGLGLGGSFQNGGGSFTSSGSSSGFVGSTSGFVGPSVGPIGGGSIGSGSFHHHHNGGLNGGLNGGFQQGFQNGGSFQQQTGFQQGFQNGGSFQSTTGFQNGVVGGGFQQGGFVSTPGPLIQKHIYVHVPPPDPEDVRAPHIHGQFAPPQKHYKIIFIKAPAPPQYGSASLPLPPQNEEKTLVYVLVKKPEDASDIYLNNAPTTPPSKPEVYFIKYKTQKDRQNQQQIVDNGLVGPTGPTLVNGGGIAGGSISGGSISGGSISGGSISGGSSITSTSGSLGPAPQYGPPTPRF